MVTGDNALTAISVGRQCGIIKPHHRIFLGDVPETKTSSTVKAEVIEWKDYEFAESELDPKTLRPNNELYASLGNHSFREMIPALHASSRGDSVHDYAKRARRELYGSLINEDENTSYVTELRKSTHEGNKEEDLPRRKRSSNGEVVVIEGDPLRRSIQDHHSGSQEVPWRELDTDDYVLCVTGRAMSCIQKMKEKGNLDPIFFKTFLDRAQVFSRMHPDQKALLVSYFQEKDIVVGMCGDGANDCNALKTADIGISLSEAEASIAAPFTSKVQDISCVITLLQEGRASLTSSFQCFKYTALYSMIQFFCLIILFNLGSDLTDWEYMYTDLVIVFPLSILMNYTLPASKLSRQQPPSALVSRVILTSVIGHVVIVLSTQIGLTYWLFSQPSSWFTPCSILHPGGLNNDSVDGCFENTTLFYFTLFQFLGTLFAFNISKPFRRPMYTNISFTLLSIFAIIFSVYLLMIPAQFIYDLFLLMEIPSYWRLIIFGSGIVYLLITFIFEKFMVRCFVSLTRCVKP
eukprot:TRINITY_DN13144_c0_g1_i1.p1 TRINITY_DN13144_c0_g1~~TRINITY_DN13144_c0_g1_i1.p1  ORF type:complete len:520 (-),score=54.80 TRINITY_DN13144_c0_g1_i1:65-1624(-)